MRSTSLFKRLAVALSTIGAIGFIAAGSASAQEQTIRVGTVSGPDAEVWQVVQKVAKRNGLNVKVVEFNDYVQPNARTGRRRPGCQQLPAPTLPR